MTLTSSFVDARLPLHELRRFASCYPLPFSTGRSMPLKEEFESTGNWLFRWRSYIPISFFVPLLIEMRNFDWPMHSHDLQWLWECCCIGVSCCGLGIRAFTVGYVPAGTSGRNTQQQVADVLNTTGMYSITRHPLYLGNFLMWLGLALFALDWRLLLIFVLAFWLYYERILFAEEEFLRRKFGREFEAWASRTPPFVPRISLWARPSIPFSLRTVLRREYSGFFAMISVFGLLDFLADWIVQGEPVGEPFYISLGIVGAAVYVALRMLKRKTRLLDVAGRC